jgi:acetyltransferase-like isoleucine patch superfamily enzyme
MLLADDGGLLRTKGLYYFKPVTLADEVGIGYQAIIMPGVTIGDRSIVG